MNEIVKHLLILLVIAGTIFFTNLGSARLWDRDEPRNAGCASEMLARGDWVVPIFNDELRPQKPVLLYWLMMSAYGIFGVNEFAGRFWSALLALGTVLATYHIARRLFSGKVALLSACVLSTTLMFDVAARAATPDSVLIFCGTMALLIYVLSVFKKATSGSLPYESTVESSDVSGFPKWPAAIGIYVFLGLGTLAKGPVGFLLPMAMIGMFMLMMRSQKVSSDRSNHWIISWLQSCWQVINPIHFFKTLWAMKPVLAIVVILLVAAPWYIWVGIRTEGDFLEKFFLNENFARATTAMENHSGGLWYYPATILMGFFPWSVFAVPIGLFLVRSIRNNVPDSNLPAFYFLTCWVAVQVGLFSLASTKLPSYVTPCYPALAIITAAGLSSFVAGQKQVSENWFRVATAVFAFSGLMIITAMVIVARKYLSGDIGISLIGLAPLIGGCLAFWWVSRGSRQAAITTITVSAILFCLGFFGFGTVIVDRHRDMANVLEPLIDSDSEIATFGVLESSWVFYAQKRIFELAPDKNPKHPKSLQRKKNWAPKPWVTPEVFAELEKGLILTTEEKVGTLLERLPTYEVLEKSPYFLQDQDLVLVGPKIKNELRQANAQRPSNLK